VLKAGGVGENGGLYLLDMGEPVYIRDLAKQMIRFYGFEPDRDIKIEYTGTRKGERLDESLWAEDEEPIPTEFNRILKVQQNPEYQCNTALDIEKLLEQLEPVIHYKAGQSGKYRSSALLFELLEEAIPSMKKSEAFVSPGQKLKESVF
jgi:FlaA1/EpsC-like NDP-sugar epimerase